MDDYKIIIEQEHQTVMARADESGTCGNNATWTYSKKNRRSPYPEVEECIIMIGNVHHSLTVLILIRS